MLSVIVLLAFVLPQAVSPQAPIRLGDAARRLSLGDMVAIADAAAAMGSAVWLVAAEDGRLNSPSRGVHAVEAYQPPQTTTADLRRGTGTLIVKSPMSATGWSMQSTFNWAQVRIADRDFGDIRSDRDVNRPLTVSGRLRDNEVLGLVRFVRGGPPVPQPEVVPGGHVPADWPIMSISRGTETFKVLLRAEKREALVLDLRNENNAWSVVSAAMVSID
ncbi:MAG TPA: hypothetical protein VFO19_09645 [Vicinamibacterales bacterium]|nr:hypothetical protein [Vicinamibacterales bacterium]